MRYLSGKLENCPYVVVSTKKKELSQLALNMYNSVMIDPVWNDS
jgi:hypothetical protein